MERISESDISKLYNDTEIISWLKDLRYFCLYKGGLSSYVTDGDHFEVHLDYQNSDHLIKILSKLGIGEAFNNSPGLYFIESNLCYVEIKKEYIVISPTEGKEKIDWQVVTLKEYEICKNIEKIIDNNDLKGDVSISHQDKVVYINRDKYPSLFS